MKNKYKFIILLIMAGILFFMLMRRNSADEQRKLMSQKVKMLNEEHINQVAENNYDLEETEIVLIMLQKVKILNEEYINQAAENNYDSEETEIVLRKRAMEASKQKLILFQALLNEPDKVYSKYSGELPEIYGNVRKIENNQENTHIEVWECAGEGRLFVGLDSPYQKYSYFIRYSEGDNVSVQCLQYVDVVEYTECYLLEEQENKYLVLIGGRPEMSGKKLVVEAWQVQEQVFIPIEVRHIYGWSDKLSVEYEGADDELGTYFFRESNGMDVYSFNNTILFDGDESKLVYDDENKRIVIEGGNEKLILVFCDNDMWLERE